MLKLHKRAILAACTLFCVLAALLAGRSLYLRSDRHRLAVQAKLAGFFGMPVDVGAVEPAGWSSRELSELRISLPDRRATVFQCPRATWTGGNGGHVIRLEGPTLTMGSGSWEREDYRRVLRASLAHDFSEIRLREVVFERASMVWQRRDFELRAEGVEGSIRFDERGTGQASFVSSSLNGIATAEPIRITARVDPHAAELLPEVTLTVPRMPLTQLGLGAVLQKQVTQGTFAGKVTLLQSEHGDRVELAGSIEDVRLEELTARVSGGPVSALLDLNLDEVVVADRALAKAVFRGEIRQLDMNSILPRLGIPAIGGKVKLSVLRGELADGRIIQLQAGGEWVGGSLEALTRAVLGRGGVRGQLRMKMNSLVVENDRLTSGDIDLAAVPPADGEGSIDRNLLLDIIQRQFGLSLPDNLLPQTVEFVHLGAKLIIDPVSIRVLSGKGPAGPALITARIFGQHIPLLPDVNQSFPIEPLLGRAAEHARQLRERLERELRKQTASKPHAPQP